MGGRVEITLLDVRKSPYPPPPGLGQRYPFAILFAAPIEPALGSSVYNLRHPGRGLIEGIYIAPVVPPADQLKKTPDVRFYEAIFN